MFFILSKLLNFLTNPLVLVGSLLLCSLFFKSIRRKRIFFWAGIGLLVFFSNDFIANEVMSMWEVPTKPYTELKKVYSLGIVLTGVTANDRMPDDRVYFHHGADRVVHTVELYKKGIIRKILVSGGDGRLVSKSRNEAEELSKAMLLMGVPATDIILEKESRNTHESAVHVKELLKSEKTEDLLLITSAFHMRRSVACFRKVGFNTIDNFSCDFYTHPRTFTPDSIIVPQAESVAAWQKILKEWAGMVAYKLAGYI
jgi:uncharacterized SAM-binding protein YcdF (DUF218 family)